LGHKTEMKVQIIKYDKWLSENGLRLWSHWEVKYAKVYELPPRKYPHCTKQFYVYNKNLSSGTTMLHWYEVKIIEE